MKKLLIILLALFTTATFAQEEQQAKQILLSSVSLIQKSPLQTKFQLSYFNPRSADENITKEGTLVISGRKFVVKMADVETF
ncbi:MAG TPA: hypothetical protein PLK20_04035, partial [Paludibacteraceae bacterium]|nr:hypothetical protein [Paludibacteraceae bacterium]